MAIQLDRVMEFWMTGIPVDVAGQLDDFLRACRSSGGSGVTPGSQLLVGLREGINLDL